MSKLRPGDVICYGDAYHHVIYHKQAVVLAITRDGDIKVQDINPATGYIHKVSPHHIIWSKAKRI